jgi:hypothetical protein
LLWKNTQNGGFAAWTLNSSATFVSGRSVTLGEIRTLESEVGADVDGDGSVGVPGGGGGGSSETFTLRSTLGSVGFGTTPGGYALRVGSQVLPVIWGSSRASDALPGGGWVGLGARQSGSGYELLWRNTQNGGFAAWTLNSSATFVSGRAVTLGEIRTLESEVGADVDGDGSVGVPGGGGGTGSGTGNASAPIVQTMTFNQTTRTATIVFDRPVTGVTVGDFWISGATGGFAFDFQATNPQLAPHVGAVSVSGSGRTWNLTLAKVPLQQSGSYAITLVAANSGIVDEAGNALTADKWTFLTT